MAKKSTRSKPEWKHICPAPRPPTTDELTHWELGDPTMVFPFYLNEKKELHGLELRFEMPNGKKEIRPMVCARNKEGKERWCFMGLTAPRPLFSLPELINNPRADIIVVEGPKSAMTLQRELPADRFVAVSWQGGANACVEADWSVLKGRNVFLLPDNDKAGFDAMGKIHAQVKPIATRVRWVKPPDDAPDKWDYSDMLSKQGKTIDQLIECMLAHIVDDADVEAAVLAAPDEQANTAVPQMNNVPVEQGVEDDGGNCVVVSAPKPLICFDPINLSIGELYQSITSIISPTKRFFSYAGQVVFVNDKMELEYLTDRTLPGFLNPSMEFQYASKSDARYGLLTQELSRGYLCSPEVKAALPIIEQFAHTPVFDKDWNYIGTPGYHPALKFYYAGPEIIPIESTEAIEELVSDVCFETPADKANFIGMLLRPLYGNRFPGKIPLTVVNGNKQGVGKSTLPLAQGIVIDGKAPTPISYNPDDAEFEKQIATCVLAGASIVVIDNVKIGKHYSSRQHEPKEVGSAVLERSLTYPILNFRQLGSNTSISRPNTIMFALTMNYATLGPDLIRRHIPINLKYDGDISKRRFKHKDFDCWVLEHRERLLAELARMILKRTTNTNPVQYGDLTRHSMSALWSETTDAILRDSGYSGFLTNFDSSEIAFSEDYKVVRDLCDYYLFQGEYRRAGDWADAAYGLGLWKDGFEECNGLRGRETAFGMLLGRFVGKRFAGEKGNYDLRTKKDGSGTAYGFEKVVTVEERLNG